MFTKLISIDINNAYANKGLRLTFLILFNCKAYPDFTIPGPDPNRTIGFLFLARLVDKHLFGDPLPTRKPRSSSKLAPYYLRTLRRLTPEFCEHYNLRQLSSNI
jgi:hypothetical protein